MVERVDTSPWNLSLAWALPLGLACGPVVGIDDGGSSSGTDPVTPDPTDPSAPTLPDPTGVPPGCSYARPCDYGYDCVYGECQPSPYCPGGGCCYGEFGGCAECYALVDCGPGQHCYSNDCQAGVTVPYCDVALDLVAELIPIPSGEVVRLAFLDAEPPVGDDLLVGCSAGVVRIAAESREQTNLGSSTLGFALDLAAGDIDGDGDDDVVADQVFRYGILVELRNDGDEGFARLHEQATYSSHLELADIDGDGYVDRVGAFVSSLQFAQVEVARGDGDFGFAAPVVFASPSAPIAVAVGHLGGPGAAIAAFDGDNLQIWDSGSITDAPTFWFAGVGGVDRAALAIGDFDGDGRAEVVRTVPRSGWTMIDVFRATDVGLQQVYTSTVPGEYLHITAVEIDGDGIDDLALVDGGTTLAVLHGGVTGLASPFSCVTTHASAVVGAVDIVRADSDGDARDEIVIADSATVAVHRAAD